MKEYETPEWVRSARTRDGSLMGGSVGGFQSMQDALSHRCWRPGGVVVVVVVVVVAAVVSGGSPSCF
eukprot:3985345-Amphidinium_carterae.4